MLADAQPPLLPPRVPLWKHQTEMVRRALAAFYFAFFCGVGTGKTAATVNVLRQLFYRRQRVLRTLILCPVVMRETWRREIGVHSKLAPSTTVLSGTGKNRLVAMSNATKLSTDHIFVTNFEAVQSKELYDAIVRWQPEVIVVDECFAEGTLIDTPNGSKPIESVKIGDKVISALGIDEVTDCFKNPVSSYAKVTFLGSTIECSLGHLWLTNSGWKKAADLQTGDILIEAAEAMQLVQGCTRENTEEQLLQLCLLREVAIKSEGSNIHSRTKSQGKQSVTWKKESAAFGNSQSIQSDVQSRNTEKSQQYTSCDELGSAGKGGKRPWTNDSRAETSRSSWGRVFLELCGCVGGRAKSWLSYVLQIRLSFSKSKTRDRSGWIFSLQPKKSGREKRLKASRIRVDSVEIYERSDFAGSEQRYFYDLSVKGHPSYSVNGVLVHNCQRIKNYKAKRTKLITALGDRAQYRYILSGTPITNSPMDIFAQFRFLDKGLEFEHNFFTFRRRYFEDRNAGMTSQKYFPDWRPKPGVEKIFNEKIARHSMRVVKEDCLDLPPIVRKVTLVEMGKEQRRMYDSMKSSFVAYLNDKACVASIALTKALRLQQIVSGFFVDDEEHTYAFKDVPRLEALRELVEMIVPNEKLIIWATFKQNYDDIAKILKDLDVPFSRLIGGMTDRERTEGIDAFQTDASRRVMLANQQAGGVGVTLTAASTMLYYSRTYSLEADLQSEARCHRAGSEVFEKITRIDLVTPATIDEVVLEALYRKMTLSELILSLKGSV